MINRRKLKCSGGFSLIELLTVLAIMAIIIGIAAVAGLGSKSSSALMVSAGQMSSLTTLARNTAISKGTVARLCILKDSPISPDEDNYALVSIWSYDRAASAAAGAGTDIWKQETKWERLTQGIVFDNYTVTGAAAPNGYNPSPTSSQQLLPIKNNIVDANYMPNFAIATFSGMISGSAIDQNNCAFLEFDGTGGLSDETAGTIGFRLVQGNYAGKAAKPNYTHPDKADPNYPADYAFVSVNSLTGRVDIVRKTFDQ